MEKQNPSEEWVNRIRQKQAFLESIDQVIDMLVEVGAPPWFVNQVVMMTDQAKRAGYATVMVLVTYLQQYGLHYLSCIMCDTDVRVVPLYIINCQPQEFKERAYTVFACRGCMRSKDSLANVMERAKLLAIQSEQAM